MITDCLYAQIRDTSVLVRLRPAWEDLRSYLTAKGRKRFEVYVCTMAERDYALEMWRLLDPEAHLINSKQLLDRVVCVKSGKRYILRVCHASIGFPSPSNYNGRVRCIIYGLIFRYQGTRSRCITNFIYGFTCQLIWCSLSKSLLVPMCFLVSISMATSIFSSLLSFTPFTIRVSQVHGNLCSMFFKTAIAIRRWQWWLMTAWKFGKTRINLESM